jgi:hypothetical protein
MTQEFIPYQEALEMKQPGFDEPCIAGYQCRVATLFSDIPHTMTGNIHKNSEGITAAPLYQQAFRWFKEKYGLCSWITMELGNKSTFCWVLSGEHTSTQYAAYFHTYEEAELACLKKLIEIAKQQL